MVGPEIEKTGLVRKSARVLAAFANATVPMMTVVLRKAYGLGYYVMGSQPLNPAILLAWPTAEYRRHGAGRGGDIIYQASSKPSPMSSSGRRCTSDRPTSSSGPTPRSRSPPASATTT